jgi:hypothetical protein
MKKIILVLAMILLPVAGFAQTYSGKTGDLNWSLSGGTLTISGSGAMPDYVDKGSPWYNYRENITSVKIEDGVTTIGNNAFYNCHYIASVKIGNSVTTIGNNAFYNCIILNSVDLSSVMTIGKLAFASCSNLNSVEIPNSVKSIGENAFADCISLQSVTIGKSVEDLRPDIFSGCTNFTSVTIHCTTICDGAFKNLGNLASLTIGNSVEKIGESAFQNCDGLTSVTIPNSVKVIGRAAFAYSHLTSVTIGNSVTTIGHAAFYATSLTSVTSLAVEPPSLNGLVFEYISTNTLTVPTGSESAYAASEWGNYFSNIVEGAGGSASLTVAPESLNFAAAGETKPVTVTSNVSWTVSTTNTWIDITPVLGNGTGDGSFNITTTANTTPSQLAGTVTVSGGGITRTITVTQAAATATSDFEYEVIDATTCRLKEYKGAGGAVAIPQTATISGSTYSVREIGQGAFVNTGITSVDIPPSVTTIGTGAFGNCSSLTTVVLPGSVTSLGQTVFANCTNLTSIDLSNISVTSIEKGAFGFCSSLTSVTIPVSVTNIAENAFANCTGLTDVTVKWSTPLANVHSKAFLNVTTSNVALHVPSGTETAYSIANVWKEFKLTVPPPTSDFEYEVINATTCRLKKYNGAGGAVQIPQTATISVSSYTVTEIGEYAFSECSSLTSVKIPDLVTTIGGHAFENCSSLVSVTIGNKVTTIGEASFHQCSKLASVEIPNSVTTIGNSAFASCSNLVTATIGSSVTTIGGYAFSGCSKLASVTIPDLVTTIGSYAFENCSSLVSATIGNRVTTIGDASFYNCSKLASVEIPNSVTTIGGLAFADCSSLATVTIGNKVTTITDYAFRNCTGLRDVTVDWQTPLAITDNVFAGVSTAAATLHVPTGKEDAYRAADVWKRFRFAGDNTPSVAVSPYHLDFTAAGATKPVDVISNTDWTVRTNEEWITFSPLSGNGNGALNITARPTR